MCLLYCIASVDIKFLVTLLLYTEFGKVTSRHLTEMTGNLAESGFPIKGTARTNSVVSLLFEFQHATLCVKLEIAVSFYFVENLDYSTQLAERTCYNLPADQREPLILVAVRLDRNGSDTNQRLRGEERRKEPRQGSSLRNLKTSRNHERTVCTILLLSYIIVVSDSGTQSSGPIADHCTLVVTVRFVVLKSTIW